MWTIESADDVFSKPPDDLAQLMADDIILECTNADIRAAGSTRTDAELDQMRADAQRRRGDQCP
jgi:hypothetical protein